MRKKNDSQKGKNPQKIHIHYIKFTHWITSVININLRGQQQGRQVVRPRSQISQEESLAKPETILFDIVILVC